MESLLTEGHPLRCQTVVEREKEPDQGSQSRCKSPGAALSLRQPRRTPGDSRRAARAAIPYLPGIVCTSQPGCRWQIPPRASAGIRGSAATQRDKARHPRKLYRELRPHRFEEPCAHNDPQHSEPDLRYLHASPPSAARSWTIRMEGMLESGLHHMSRLFHEYHW